MSPRKKPAEKTKTPVENEVVEPETLSAPPKEIVLSETQDLAKSKVLDGLKKKSKKSIPDANALLEEIQSKTSSEPDEKKDIKDLAEKSLHLASDETIELKVIKKFAADQEKRTRFFSRFNFAKKKNHEATTHQKIDLKNAVRYLPRVDEGLDTEKIEERKANNYTNSSKTNLTKSIGRIFADNIFTFFNMLLTIIAIALICVGSFTDLFFMVIALCNTGIGIFQEVKAKIAMDKLNLITAPTCTVVRNSQAISIPIEDVVLDDIILVSTGNQIASDSIIKKGQIEVNESLLTGESLPIKKQEGDLIYAGSFVVSGSAACQVDRVGDANYSSSIQSKVKQYSKPTSELVKALNTLIKAISMVIIPLGAVLFYLNYSNAEVAAVFDKVKQSIELTAGSLIGMIPAGMYLLTTVALAAGVLRIQKRQTVVQKIYGIEMLARANVLCLDKTGTLTDGTMSVEEVVILDKSLDVAKVMGSYLSTFEDNNQTSIALQQAFSYNSEYRVSTKIPFSSSRKYSAVTFEKAGTFILGAPEYVYPEDDPALKHLLSDKQARGYRVLMLAHTNAQIKGEKISGVIQPVAIFVLIDHIRPEAPTTIKWFNENGVEIKIISGDNPLTASEIAKACGVPSAENWVSLEGLSVHEVTEIANKYTVFGRVSPEQKATLVQALKNQQKVVAMTGDGVNDILAMKNSDCSIAMASGADAAKSVAHLVLLNSNFASMPKVVEEGRRVVNNITRSSALFLMKTFFTISLSIFVIVSNIFGSKMVYPFSPKNLMIMEVFCIGIPSTFLAIQPNKNRISGHFLRNVVFRALPGTIMLLIAIGVSMLLGNYGFYEYHTTGEIFNEAVRTMSVITMVLCGLAMLYQISKPMDLYRTILLIAMFIGATLAVFILPSSTIGIDFMKLNKIQWLVVAVLGFASFPLASLLDSIFTRFRTDAISLKTHN